MVADQFGDRFIVPHTTQKGHGAQIGDGVSVAQDRYQHLAVYEAAAIEQRKNEIDVRFFEEHFILVGELEIEAQIFQRRAYFVVVDCVIAVFGVHPAAEQGVLGHEQCADALLGFFGNAQRFDASVHVDPLVVVLARL